MNTISDVKDREPIVFDTRHNSTGKKISFLCEAIDKDENDMRKYIIAKDGIILATDYKIIHYIINIDGFGDTILEDGYYIPEKKYKKITLTKEDEKIKETDKLWNKILEILEDDENYRMEEIDIGNDTGVVDEYFIPDVLNYGIIGLSRVLLQRKYIDSFSNYCEIQDKITIMARNDLDPAIRRVKLINNNKNMCSIIMPLNIQTKIINDKINMNAVKMRIKDKLDQL
jgi:hypothetical protein